MNPKNQNAKGLFDYLSSQLFQEMCIKSKNIFSLPLLVQKKGVI